MDFACRPASQPAVRPGCAYETVVPKTIFLLRYGDSFVLPISIGMCKQLASPQHSIHGVNREVNAPG